MPGPSIAEHRRAILNPLPERRRPGERGVAHQRAFVQLATLEADRADEQLTTTLRVLAEQLGERRAAIARDALGGTAESEPDRLLGEERDHVLALLRGRRTDEKRDRDPLRVLESGGQVDHDF